jgi:hypothetical protein
MNRLGAVGVPVAEGDFVPGVPEGPAVRSGVSDIVYLLLSKEFSLAGK